MCQMIVSQSNTQQWHRNVFEDTRDKKSSDTHDSQQCSNDSVTNLRQDISSIIEQSFGSRNGQSTPSSVSSGNTLFSEKCVDTDNSQTFDWIDRPDYQTKILASPSKGRSGKTVI